MKDRFIYEHQAIIDALRKLHELGTDLTLFVLNSDEQMTGTLTDGDIRRALINAQSLETKVSTIMNTDFQFFEEGSYDLQHLDAVRSLEVSIVPVLDKNKRFVKLINFKEQQSVLPVHAVVMAGGEGIRLRPLTQKTPKPLLKVGNKTILDHGIDRLKKFGIENITVCLNYLGDQVKSHLGDGSEKGLKIGYVTEEKMLGTIGAVTLIKETAHDHILVINSDLLTNIDFEAFYREFLDKDADISIASVPYNINIPYALLDTENDTVKKISEKPTLTYYSNAGIYLIKKECFDHIPKNSFFNATDLVDEMLKKNKKVVYFPLLGYWLDIGKMDDYHKAQQDIRYLQL